MSKILHLLGYAFIFVVLVSIQSSAAIRIPSNQQQKVDYTAMGRTSGLVHIPFFGGGIRNLLRFIRPNAHLGRKSDFRSEFDENFVNYHAAQLWKVNTNVTALKRGSFNEQIQQFVEKFGNEVWNINQDGVDILIDAKNTAKAKDFISKTELTYNIMIDDIEKAIDETYMEVNSTNPKMPWLERENTLMNWNRYHDIGDIQQFLQHMLEVYPDYAEIVQIGLTGNKRPMEVLRISNGDPNNWAVFIDAGYQARDWLSVAAITYAISKLTWQWESKNNPMRNIDWHFLPVANPDGYQYSRITDRLWAKNRHFDSETGCYGVNLERNFEYKWGGDGATDNPCKNLYSGQKKFSEPETRAIRNYLLGLSDYLGAYVSFGAYGQAITYPWGDADYVTDNRRQLHYVGRKAVMNFRKLNSAEYSVGSSYRMKYARSGNPADWVQYRINPQYVYNVYLKDQGRYGYLMPPHYIVESGEEAYEFMRTLAVTLN